MGSQGRRAAPPVSVLMPAYNMDRFLPAAMDSIFGQTFPDFEVVVVDDGSTDSTGEVLAGYEDPRLHIVRHGRNNGLAAAYNTAINAARGEYVAVMDADDVSLPTRLERQMEFLAANPHVGVLGANYQPIDDHGRPSGPPTAVPTLSGHIHWMLHMHNCVNHPAAMIRRALLVSLGGYRDAAAALDYDLWVRAAPMTRLANLSDVLVLYRQHDSNVSFLWKERSTRMAEAVALRAQASLLGGTPSVQALRVLREPETANRATEHVLEAARVLSEITRRCLELPGLPSADRSAIRRSAREGGRRLVAACLPQRPALAWRSALALRGAGRPGLVLPAAVATRLWRAARSALRRAP